MIKKKFLGLAFIAMSLVAFNGMAQDTTSSNNNSTCNNASCQENVRGKKADRQNRNAKMNPFEGLTLSDTQKAQLQQLNAQRKADRQQMAQTRKDNKQRNDSARIAERRAAKKSYLEQVKTIIGPDQYVVFLENMYVNGGAQGHGKAFKKGDRNDKQGFAKDRQSKDKRHKGDRKHASNRTAATQAQTQS